MKNQHLLQKLSYFKNIVLKDDNIGCTAGKDEFMYHSSNITSHLDQMNALNFSRFLIEII